VTGANPQHVGGAGAPPPDAAAWARPGQATVATPASPSQEVVPYPYPQQPPAPAARRGWAQWTVIGASAVLAIAAVTMGVIDLTRPSPTPTTTTVTAGAPAFPPDQVAAAKKESCAASLNAASAMHNATQQLANIPDRNSPQWQAALANVQNVVMVETTYLELHTPPATPPEIANPTRDFINAYRDAADLATRGLDNSAPISRTQTAVDSLNKACR
jgi:hypothetical protein